MINKRKGEIPTGIIVAIVLGLIAVLIVVSISGGLGENAKDATTLDNAEEQTKDMIFDKKCAMHCTAHCIDDSYSVPMECQAYITECCDCDGVTDITEGCDAT